MKACASELLQRLPGPVTARWPAGERFVQAFAHGTMSVELYAPVGIETFRMIAGEMLCSPFTIRHSAVLHAGLC